MLTAESLCDTSVSLIRWLFTSQCEQKRTKPTMLFIISLLLFSTSLAHLWCAPVSVRLRSRHVQRFGRYGQTHIRVFIPAYLALRDSRASLPASSGLSMGQRPFPSSAMCSHSIEWRLKWNATLYEKRYYYQLHGERTSYRHS